MAYSVEYHRQWRKANRQKVRDCAKVRRDRSPIESLFHNAQCRAKKRKTLFSLTKDQIVVPDLCPLCDEAMFRRGIHLSTHSPTLDEIVPGGGYTPSNTWVICHGCNRRKSNMRVEDLRRMADRIETQLISCAG